MERHLKGGPGICAAVTFFYFGTAGIISTFYYMFLQQKVGLELSEIGKVTSFGAVFSFAFQPFLGYRYSMSRDKKTFIRLYFLGLILVLTGMILVTEKIIFLFAVLYGCIALPMIGTYEIYLEEVCRQETIAYPRIRKWGSIGMGTVTLLGGSIISAFSFTGFDLLGIFFLIICIAAVSICFPVLHIRGGKEKTAFADMFSPRYIKPLYLVCFLGMGSYVGSDFAFSTYLTELCSTVEKANRIFSLSSGTKIFLEFVFFIIVGKFIRRFRIKRIFLSVFLISFFRFALIATGFVPAVVLGDLLHCIVFPVFLTVIFDYLHAIVDDRLTAGCYSIISMLMFGVSNLVFPLLLSWIEGQLGFRVMYVADCIFALTAAAAGWGMLPEAERI